MNVSASFIRIQRLILSNQRIKLSQIALTFACLNTKSSLIFAKINKKPELS